MFAILLGLAVALLFAYLINEFRRPANYPPGPPWLPVVGNTPYIRKLARQYGGQHKVFELLGKIYRSNVIGLKLGREYVVVALNYPAVNEVHRNDVFAGRPNNFFIRLRTMGTRLGVTCTDGPFWVEHRSFVTRHLRQVGYGRQPMQLQIQNELNELVDVIREREAQPIWPGSILSTSVINVLWTFVTGTRIPRDDDRLQRLLRLLQDRSKAFDMSGGVLSQLPWLRFIAPEWSGYNLLRRFNLELNEFFAPTIAAHHRDFSEEKANDDLIYGYIKEMRDRREDPDTTFTDRQLTMIILDIFIAGGQTTSTTLDLAFMMMIVRPDIQARIRKEIDETLRPDELPNQQTDRTQLPYTDAFLLEVQRFFHIVPVSGPRRTLSDCTLGGYRLPKNTTVLIGLRTVHMDPDYWGDPEVFRPERFLESGKGDASSAGKVHLHTDRLMFFGIGKRRCLGEVLARACLFTFFVGVMQKFELLKPTEASDPEAEPSIVLRPGITLSPKPYTVVFRPRL
ncbi:probable cytochrome P450 305a1 [Anopheles stephensi]|uniref:probable cytochrome P450 305a1 n=1 Tax=Anopheles stephensi TaxID=30069 RepID=UPI001658B0C2|nr:probable cytochrome P450 305a1 [Anopheles stephensi]